MTMAVSTAVLYSWSLQSQACYTVLVMVSFPLDIPRSGLAKEFFAEADNFGIPVWSVPVWDCYPPPPPPPPPPHPALYPDSHPVWEWCNVTMVDHPPQRKTVQYTTPYIFFQIMYYVERYVRWGCILNCFMPSTLLVFLLFAVPTDLHTSNATRQARFRLRLCDFLHSYRFWPVWPNK